MLKFHLSHSRFLKFFFLGVTTPNPYLEGTALYQPPPLRAPIHISGSAHVGVLTHSVYVSFVRHHKRHCRLSLVQNVNSHADDVINDVAMTSESRGAACQQRQKSFHRCTGGEYVTGRG